MYGSMWGQSELYCFRLKLINNESLHVELSGTEVSLGKTGLCSRGTAQRDGGCPLTTPSTVGHRSPP